MSDRSDNQLTQRPKLEVADVSGIQYPQHPHKGNAR